MINAFVDIKIINQIIEKTEKIIDIIQPIIDDKIIPTIEFIKEQKRKLDEFNIGKFLEKKNKALF